MFDLENIWFSPRSAITAVMELLFKGGRNGWPWEHHAGVRSGTEKLESGAKPNV